jgi:hypothetical protein
MALAAGAMLGLLAGTAGASIAKADDLPLLDTLSDAQTYYMINIEQIQERFFGLTWTNSIYYRKLLEKPISLDAVEQNNIIDKATADAVVARDRGWAFCDTFKEKLDMASALVRRAAPLSRDRGSVASRIETRDEVRLERYSTETLLQGHGNWSPVRLNNTKLGQPLHLSMPEWYCLRRRIFSAFST